ncbi:MAG: hypothetical protein AVDCRST_MAG47-987 [uncultured Nocardioidaceae bacterium]|uniref:Uncharacterized protein n=1 Tax=uncultured Nocardioidaceae bacterium TaxID=253824 RepID=A0A6J4MUF4_9ACTN|nr:MAG: hypothetical protein AVDCRST_MAG47-987 [uncultured Nocardioidaceae bacterium]
MRAISIRAKKITATTTRMISRILPMERTFPQGPEPGRSCELPGSCPLVVRPNNGRQR